MLLVSDDIIVVWLCFATFLYLLYELPCLFVFFLSTGPAEELSKTKRVRIAEKVILEDESKPKKKKDGKK